MWIRNWNPVRLWKLQFGCFTFSSHCLHFSSKPTQAYHIFFNPTSALSSFICFPHVFFLSLPRTVTTTSNSNAHPQHIVTTNYGNCSLVALPSHHIVSLFPLSPLKRIIFFQSDQCSCCCCCRPHSTNVLPAESSTRNHVAASSLSPQVAKKGSTLSGFVQRSRLEREVGRDLHSNKWEEV